MSILANAAQIGFLQPSALGKFSFTDDFNRADGSALSNNWSPIAGSGWINSTDWTIASNQLNAPLNYDNRGIRRASDILNSVQEITINSKAGGSGGVGLCSRIASDGSCYVAYFSEDGNYAGFRRMVGGNLYVISAAGNNPTINNGDRCRFTTIGSSLTWEIIRNGATIQTLNYTSTSITAAGKNGIMCDYAGLILDDYLLQEI